MVEDSYKASYIPEPSQVKRLFELSNTIASVSQNEKEWYVKVKDAALNWLF
jgi:hypothetical protein